MTDQMLFATEALTIATRRNLLTDEDRVEMRKAIDAGNEAEAISWGSLVTFDLGQRCRSFVPAELVELRALAAKAFA